MKTRWGSCGHSGRILLNPRLVQTPLSCIDYVILHELCHLKEHNHSKEYYQLLDQVLPTWRDRRQKLNQFECC
jgi:predicted metal-dependent hydrolase